MPWQSGDMVTPVSEPESNAPPSTHPAKPLRVAIIGTGSIGERHLRCFQASGRAEVIACEPNRELGAGISERYGCPWFTTLEEALGQPCEMDIFARQLHPRRMRLVQ